jgi:hypothetical protein
MKHTRDRPLHSKLPITEQHKILGILIDRRLRFHTHCEQIRHKFYIRLLWLQNMKKTIQHILYIPIRIFNSSHQQGFAFCSKCTKNNSCWSPIRWIRHPNNKSTYRNYVSLKTKTCLWNLNSYASRFLLRATRFATKPISTINEHQKTLIRLRTEQSRTYDWLYRHKQIQENHPCYYCGLAPETLQHLFTTCEQLRQEQFKLLRCFRNYDPHLPEPARYQPIMTRTPDKRLQLQRDKAIISFLREIKFKP